MPSRAYIQPKPDVEELGKVNRTQNRQIVEPVDGGVNVICLQFCKGATRTQPLHAGESLVNPNEPKAGSTRVGSASIKGYAVGHSDTYMHDG